MIKPSSNFLSKDMPRERKIKISLKELKIKELYDFYLLNGFDHTVEEIAKRMKIERKTFYNRYQSKEHSIEMVLGYEHRRLNEVFRQRFEYCNHSVEEIVILIWCLLQYYQERRLFFMYDVEHGHFSANYAPFRDVFDAIIENGLRSYHVQEDVDLDLYIDFFFSNIQRYIMQEQKQTGLVRYTLLPLLNERGLELLDEMDIDLLLS